MKLDTVDLLVVGLLLRVVLGLGATAVLPLLLLLAVFLVHRNDLVFVGALERDEVVWIDLGVVHGLERVKNPVVTMVIHNPPLLFGSQSNDLSTSLGKLQEVTAILKEQPFGFTLPELERLVLVQSGLDLLSDIHHSSAILNYCHSEEGYSEALAAQRAKVKDSELTPSGRMLKEMQQNKLSFFEFSLERSKQTQKELLSSTLDDRTLTDIIGASELSLKKQAEIEASDTLDFDSYLADWNSN